MTVNLNERTMIQDGIWFIKTIMQTTTNKEIQYIYMYHKLLCKPTIRQVYFNCKDHQIYYHRYVQYIVLLIS